VSDTQAMLVLVFAGITIYFILGVVALRQFKDEILTELRSLQPDPNRLRDHDKEVREYERRFAAQGWRKREAEVAAKARADALIEVIKHCDGEGYIHRSEITALEREAGAGGEK
jgi:hypothetical protein